MTDELKCLAHPCDGVMKPNTYDASLTCSACQFQVADESEYSALVAGRQAAIDDEKQNPWKGALIDELIVDNILTEELERDPRKALAAAIDWNCKVALDPSASAEARALQQAAIDAALGDLIHDLGGLYIHRNGHELYNSAIDDVARFIKDQLGTNQLAERDARIAELESLLAEAYADADDVLRPRIEELERMLANAQAEARRHRR